VQDLVLGALEHRAAFGSAGVVLDGLVRELGLLARRERLRASRSGPETPRSTSPCMDSLTKTRPFVSSAA
jgi:hypothetical protein